MTHEVIGKLGGDHRVDGLVVGLGEIEEPPQRGLGEEVAFRIGLERNRHRLGAVTMTPQFADEAADQPLGAPVDERELRLADKNRSHGSDYTIAIAMIRAAVHCDGCVNRFTTWKTRSDD